MSLCNFDLSKAAISISCSLINELYYHDMLPERRQREGVSKNGGNSAAL
jgi:hypothetical protein